MMAPALLPVLGLFTASETIGSATTASNDWRKLSRMTRLIRFLPTACRSTCRDTAIPSREQSPSFLLANTLNQRSEETTEFLKILLNSIGLFSRALTGNVARRGGFVCRALFFNGKNPGKIWGNQADRRLRPLARRARMMALPPRVDMRARKPCLRARFRRLG